MNSDFESGMEIGTRYQFPEFEGKYEHNNEKVVKFSSKLPKFPDVKKVYVVCETRPEFIKADDGWAWGTVNKSSKTFFGNIPGVQRSVKYKCLVKGCSAAKYAESVFSQCIKDLLRESS